MVSLVEFVLILGWPLALLGWGLAYLLHKRLKLALSPPPLASPPSPAPAPDADAQAEHDRLVALGRKGAEVRKERQARREAATQEGIQIIQASNMDKEKLMAGVKLIAEKYPDVAVEVIKKLDDEAGLSRSIGVPQSLVLQGVGQIVKSALEAQGKSKEGEGADAQAAAGLPNPAGFY